MGKRGSLPPVGRRARRIAARRLRRGRMLLAPRRHGDLLRTARRALPEDQPVVEAMRRVAVPASPLRRGSRLRPDRPKFQKWVKLEAIWRSPEPMMSHVKEPDAAGHHEHPLAVLARA